MRERRLRLKRVAELRDKELQAHLVELGVSQKCEGAWRLRVEQARLAVAEAETARRALADQDMTPTAFVETEEWLASQSYRLDVATQELARASRIRAQREVEVFKARRKLRQLEKIDERLLAREKIELERVERKAHDEFALMRRRVAGGN